MKFAVLVYETAEEFAERATANETTRAAYWGGYSAYTQALTQAGALASGAALSPPETASTVRLRGGSRQVVDGPYAETREMLGGFYLIEAEDLDVALAWAERCPSAARGAVEVRPLLAM